MSNDIVPRQIGNDLRLDSRDMATQLDNQHKNVMELIAKNDALFTTFGQLPFETEIAQGGKGGKPSKFALLNEDQCYFLLTLVRNSKKVTALKAGLVMAFRAAREAAVPAFNIPKTYSAALLLSAQLEHERERLAVIVQEQAPKVEAFDTYMDSSGLLSIQRAGQLLNIGEHKLFALLRDERVLMNGTIAGEALHNTPYRLYLDKGYFEVKTSTKTLNSGRQLVTTTSYVTPKGMEFLRRLTGKKPGNRELPLLGMPA